MSTDKMREEFESWAMKKHSHYLSPFKHVDGCDPRIDGADRYLHGEVQQDWAVWQASRAAIEVELPNPAVQGGNCIRDHAIRDTLESLGLKVRP